jgi:pre-mRNA-splicing factor SYF1
LKKKKKKKKIFNFSFVQCGKVHPLDECIEVTIGAFERAVSKLGTMPVIWMLFAEFLVSHGRITLSRRVFDRALRSLPVTQHDLIWEPYIAFARECDVPETAIRVYRRYMKYAPEAREELVDYLLEGSHVDEAAKELVVLLEDSQQQVKGRTRLQLWQQLCELIALHPDQVVSLRGRVEAIVRAGVSRFPDDNTGQMWAGLANHFVGLGLFDKARDVFEEGMASCVRVRDFALLWDSYSELEEGLLQALIEGGGGDGELKDNDVAFDRQHARYESVLERRPFLLNAVQLRATPNDVSLWHHRVSLYRERKEWVQVAKTFKEAIKTVDLQAAKGKVSSLHIAYAFFYEHHKELDKARTILERATTVAFSGIDELASIYCARTELEIRNHTTEIALELLRNVCIVPPAHMRDLRGLPVQERLFRSTKLWCLLADLEESIGTSEGVRAAYDAMLDLRIATPRVVLNYAAYLEEHSFFEDSFRCYERGVDLFDFPYSLDIWIAYLVRFVKHYKGTRVERTRDVFEQAVERVPPTHAKTLYIMYADFEERFGLARRAMAVYDRATRAVPPEEQYVMFLLYIARATDLFGVTRTREIYEKAVAVLPDKFLQDICLRYADLEKRLGEVDRARAIYRHCANFCDPRSAQSFWAVWHNFEVSFGNEETFREMLRMKRAVQIKFDMRTPVLDAETVARIQAQIKQGGSAPAVGAPATPASAAKKVNLPKLDAPAADQGIVFSAPAVPNTRAISIDDDDQDGEQPAEGKDENKSAGEKRGREDDNVRIVQQSVPSAVFGSLKVEVEETKKRKV